MSAALLAQQLRPEGVEIRLAGSPALLDSSGALYLPDSETLVVADLHLEKGSSLARRGSMLPPFDTGATLAALAEAISHFRPAHVVALGDSFHDRRGPDRLLASDRRTLAALVAGRDWTWILGNHDPALPEGLGGRTAEEVELGRLILRHHPAPGSQRELAGHLHPVAKVVLHGRGVRARAFLTDGDRCVLPAVGAYAGGLNACDPAFDELFPRGFTAHVIGRQRVFSLPRAALCGD
ncbi:ligase-associated DNA damage response endonuclease PdeM [Enterovirga sp.]|uniref:ligase-associated DNA damage response endonuclease PdeM n=1 Tax=Enterovirga sp. TaxID=2026350 RepID=UPI00263008D4|nr:ligase-associated DNA damage response endonuclease PdeM [Enterovirga sp.]MDB5592457.1 pdeM [Enterovirga sp.]